MQISKNKYPKNEKLDIRLWKQSIDSLIFPTTVFFFSNRIRSRFINWTFKVTMFHIKNMTIHLSVNRSHIILNENKTKVNMDIRNS